MFQGPVGSLNIMRPRRRCGGGVVSRTTIPRAMPRFQPSARDGPGRLEFSSANDNLNVLRVIGDAPVSTSGLATEVVRAGRRDGFTSPRSVQARRYVD